MRNATHTINEITKIIGLKEDAFLRKVFPLIGSGSQLRALIAITELPNSTPSAIACHLGITKASVTGLSMSLVEAKLVEQKPHPEDKRSHFLRATQNGRNLLKRVIPKHTKMLEDFLPDAITAKKLEAWLKELKRDPKDK